MTEDKAKYELTVNFIQIIGKYFNSNEDFVNLMKVNKKYKELVSMYHFNPISEIELFENIETQHFYKEEDLKNKIDNLFKYVYWIEKTYKDYLKKENKEIFKRIKLSATKLITNDFILKDGSTFHEEKEVDVDYIDTNFSEDLDTNSLESMSEENIINNNNLSEEENLEDEGSIIYPLPILNGKLKIPEVINKIDIKCFYDCSDLFEIEFSKNLKSIGRKSFSFTSITNLIIPEGITKIDNECFSECYNLTNVKLPSSLISISEKCFYATEIKSIIIPEGIRFIKSYCFMDCSSLTSIILPSTLLEIENNAFTNTGIITINIPNNINKIDFSCLDYCDKLFSIILPEKLLVQFKNSKIKGIKQKIKLGIK